MTTNTVVRKSMIYTNPTATVQHGRFTSYRTPFTPLTSYKCCNQVTIYLLLQILYCFYELHILISPQVVQYSSICVVISVQTNWWQNWLFNHVPMYLSLTCVTYISTLAVLNLDVSPYWDRSHCNERYVTVIRDMSLYREICHGNDIWSSGLKYGVTFWHLSYFMISYLSMHYKLCVPV